MAKLSLRKAKKFSWRFADKPQEILGKGRKMWVRMHDYDELENWFNAALSHIEKLEKELKKLKKPSRK